MILRMTRAELIADLPRSFIEHNDIAAMSNKKLIGAWKWYGDHAGTWDWDNVEIAEEV